jgi:hypothetical protein
VQPSEEGDAKERGRQRACIKNVGQVAVMEYPGAAQGKDRIKTAEVQGSGLNYHYLTDKNLN